MTISKIGFIGLGIMGRPMAGHLLDAGHEVVTVRRGTLDATLAEKGLRELDSPAAVAAEAEVIITMVPDTPDVEAVLLGGLAQSKILDVHGARMIERTFDPGFRIRLHQKDLNLALEGARSLNLALPGTANAQQLFQACAAHGGAGKAAAAMAAALGRA